MSGSPFHYREGILPTSVEIVSSPARQRNDTIRVNKMKA